MQDARAYSGVTASASDPQPAEVPRTALAWGETGTASSLAAASGSGAPPLPEALQAPPASVGDLREALRAIHAGLQARPAPSGPPSRLSRGRAAGRGGAATVRELCDAFAAWHAVVSGEGAGAAHGLPAVYARLAGRAGAGEALAVFELLFGPGPAEARPGPAPAGPRPPARPTARTQAAAAAGDAGAALATARRLLEEQKAAAAREARAAAREAKREAQQAKRARKAEEAAARLEAEATRALARDDAYERKHAAAFAGARRAAVELWCEGVVAPPELAARPATPAAFEAAARRLAAALAAPGALPALPAQASERGALLARLLCRAFAAFLLAVEGATQATDHAAVNGLWTAVHHASGAPARAPARPPARPPRRSDPRPRAPAADRALGGGAEEEGGGGPSGAEAEDGGGERASKFEQEHRGALEAAAAVARELWGGGGAAAAAELRRAPKTRAEFHAAARALAGALAARGALPASEGPAVRVLLRALLHWFLLLQGRAAPAGRVDNSLEQSVLDAAWSRLKPGGLPKSMHKTCKKAVQAAPKPPGGGGGGGGGDAGRRRRRAAPGDGAEARAREAEEAFEGAEATARELFARAAPPPALRGRPATREAFVAAAEALAAALIHRGLARPGGPAAPFRLLRRAFATWLRLLEGGAGRDVAEQADAFTVNESWSLLHGGKPGPESLRLALTGLLRGDPEAGGAGEEPPGASLASALEEPAADEARPLSRPCNRAPPLTAAARRRRRRTRRRRRVNVALGLRLLRRALATWLRVRRPVVAGINGYGGSRAALASAPALPAAEEAGGGGDPEPEPEADAEARARGRAEEAARAQAATRAAALRGPPGTAGALGAALRALREGLQARGVVVHKSNALAALRFAFDTWAEAWPPEVEKRQFRDVWAQLSAGSEMTLTKLLRGVLRREERPEGTTRGAKRKAEGAGGEQDAGLETPEGQRSDVDAEARACTSLPTAPRAAPPRPAPPRRIAARAAAPAREAELARSDKRRRPGERGGGAASPFSADFLPL
eukprot:tig00001127_g7152.t1